MLKVEIKDGGVAVRVLGDIAGQARFATAMALTKSVKIAQGDVKEEMKRVFDRPTRYTLNSTFVRAAKKSDLTARIFFREFAGKGTPAAKYIFPEVYGGGRRQKSSERSLQAAGKMPAGRFIAPGAQAELDAYGNMKRGQIVKILSGLKASSDGYQNHNAKGRNRGKRKAEQYFAIGTGSQLAPGVYKRTGDKKRGIAPVMAFVSAPSYEPRLAFEETVGKAVKREFPGQFRLALEHAIATAR